MYIRTYMYVYDSILTFLSTCAHAYAQAQYIRIYTHTNIYTHVHAYTHAHTYRHIHTDTYTIQRERERERESYHELTWASKRSMSMSTTKYAHTKK